MGGGESRKDGANRRPMLMHDSVALFSNYIIAFEWETVEWLLSAIMGTSRLPPSAQPACGQDEIPLSASGAEGRLIAHFHKRHQAWFKTRALEPKASTYVTLTMPCVQRVG